MKLCEEIKKATDDIQLSTNFKTPIIDLSGLDSGSVDYILVKLSDEFPTLRFSADQIENTQGVRISAMFADAEDAGLGEIKLGTLKDAVDKIMEDPTLPRDILPYNPEENPDKRDEYDD